MEKLYLKPCSKKAHIELFSRTRRIEDYLIFKKCMGKWLFYYEKIPFDIFVKSHKPARLNIPLEILNILGEVSGFIFCYGQYLIHDRFGTGYGNMYYQQFQEYFRTAANKTSYFNGQRFTIDAIFKPSYPHHEDMSPFYRFIFSKLRALNMDLYFEREGTPFMRYIWDKQPVITAGEPGKSVEEDDPETDVPWHFKYSPGETERIRKKMLINDAESMAPDVIISAYIDVYRDYPAGYL